MITREQVADLQPGDVVEVTSSAWPVGTVLRGPIWEPSFCALAVATFKIRGHDGGPTELGDPVLTVISRAPRSLYVNHPRTEPVVGDVIRASDGEGEEPLSWVYDEDGDWTCGGGTYRKTDELVNRNLRVDGETGQVVPSQPAGDPLAHITKGDPTPEGADENPTCGTASRGWACTRKPGHAGQHIAGCGIGYPVAAVWS